MKTMDCEGSSNLKAATYNSDTQELTVTFKIGKTYSYVGVPVLAWDLFMDAPSKGSFFAQHIKPSYQARPVEQ